MDSATDAQMKSDAINGLNIAVRNIYHGKTLDAWISQRVGNYMREILNDPDRYYRRWDIRRVVFDLTQRMDCASHVCMYLAINSGQHINTGTRRTTSVVGLNRNPVSSTQLRNGRYNRTGGKPSPGWRLLVYVVLDKARFSSSELAHEMSRIGAIKGVENKVLRIMRFGIRHSAPTRFDSQMICEKSTCYKPAVQMYISSQSRLVVKNM